MHCRVILMNAYLPAGSSPDRWIDAHDAMKRESSDRLGQELARLQAEGSPNGFTFETLSYLGSIENVMPHLVREENVDYVVLGVQPEPKKDRLVKLLNRLPCPILVVPWQNGAAAGPRD